MPDNERDQTIERATEIIARMSWEGPGQEWPLWDDATIEDQQKLRTTCQPIARALADAGLLRTGDDTISGHGYKGTAADGAFVGDLLAEVEKLRAEHDWLDAQVTEIAKDRDRAVAETAALRARVEALADELWDLASDGYVLEMVSKFRHALDGRQP